MNRIFLFMRYSVTSSNLDGFSHNTSVISAAILRKDLHFPLKAAGDLHFEKMLFQLVDGFVPCAMFQHDVSSALAQSSGKRRVVEQFADGVSKWLWASVRNKYSVHAVLNRFANTSLSYGDDGSLASRSFQRGKPERLQTRRINHQARL